jgi:predicted DNA-binding protein
MPLPGTARFAKVSNDGALEEFDSVDLVVSYHQGIQKIREADGVKRNLSIRIAPRDLARLEYLADDLDVPKTTLARELLSAALIQALDSMNILEESKPAVLEDLQRIEDEITRGTR